MQAKSYWVIGCLVLLCTALTACAPTTTAKSAEKPAISEPIDKTGLKKITLTKKASERLGLQTASLAEEKVTRKFTIGAEVVGSASGDGLAVRARFNDNDLTLIDREQPVQVHPHHGSGEGLPALLDKNRSGTAKGNGWLYFVLSGNDHGFKIGQSVQIAFVRQSGSVVRKVIPYTALLYDTTGQTWTYTSDELLKFVRQKVTVDFIDGEKVYLSEGPTVGTTVVTYGAAELYGTETGVGK